jgi:hypothetical protein
MQQKGLSESMLRKAKKFEASLSTTQTQTDMATKMVDQGMSPITSAAPAAIPPVQQVQTQRSASPLDAEEPPPHPSAGLGDAALRPTRTSSSASVKVQEQRSGGTTPQPQIQAQVQQLDAKSARSVASVGSANVSVDGDSQGADALDSTAVDPSKTDTAPAQSVEERPPSVAVTVASERDANVEQAPSPDHVQEAEDVVVKTTPEEVVAGILCMCVSCACGFFAFPCASVHGCMLACGVPELLYHARRSGIVHGL